MSLDTQSAPPTETLLQSITGGLRLTLHTSMLSVYSDSQGAVGLFEFGSQFTTRGALCALLKQLPGVRFEESSASLWSPSGDHFTFKDRVYLVSVPYGDVRVAPAETGAVYPETSELLRMLREQLLPRWQARQTRLYRR